MCRRYQCVHRYLGGGVGNELSGFVVRACQDKRLFIVHAHANHAFFVITKACDERKEPQSRE
jgi:hypothetical protein